MAWKLRQRTGKRWRRLLPRSKGSCLYGVSSWENLECGNFPLMYHLTVPILASLRRPAPLQLSLGISLHRTWGNRPAWFLYYWSSPLSMAKTMSNSAAYCRAVIRTVPWTTAPNRSTRSFCRVMPRHKQKSVQIPIARQGLARSMFALKRN